MLQGMATGNQLQQRRRAVGLTQQQLADLARASRASVKLLEGNYRPRRSAVRARILRVLDDLERTAGGQQSGSGRDLSGAAPAESCAPAGRSAACERLPHERKVQPETGG